MEKKKPLKPRQLVIAEIKERIQPSGVVSLLKLIDYQLNEAHLAIETCRGDETLKCQGEMKALRKLHDLFTVKNKNRG